MKPVIFLDFDGVVNTIYWDRDENGKWGFNTFKYGKDRELTNKQAIGWLNELYSKVPYDIVVTSTWRLNRSIKELQDLITRSGFDDRIKVIGVTPILHQQRGIEIEEWLSNNNFKGKFAILDDDSDMCELLPFLVRCDTLLGFTIYDYNKTLRMIGDGINE